MIKITEAREESARLVAGALTGVSGEIGEMTSYLAQATGKAARTLVLLQAAANADEIVPKYAAEASAAVELLHIATLVHDDVIDDAPTRRGIATLHQKYGKRSAIICGDYLLCISLAMISRVDGYGEFTKGLSGALGKICKGEYSQYLNNGNIDLDMFTYLKIISGKTAALFYIAAYLGGRIGGESESNARALGRFGRCLGVVFQIIDDCKDYEFTEEEAKKPVGSDILSGVVTLPLILAMRKDPELQALARETMADNRVVSRLVEATRRAGGPDEARKIAQRYEKSAVNVLQAVSEKKRENLLAIMRKTLSASKVF